MQGHNKLNKQVALGAYLGEHGSTVFAYHGTRVRLEYDGLCVRLHVPVQNCGLTARKVKVKVSHAALAEAAKETRYERATNGVVLGAIFVHDISYAQLGLFVKELAHKRLVPNGHVVQVGVYLLLLLESIRQAFVHLVDAELGLHYERQVGERIL
jgi:hypothetical protein